MNIVNKTNISTNEMLSSTSDKKISKPEQDKIQGQTNQIFNIAESVVMEYISHFLEEEASVIFKDTIPQYVEPLILLPLDDYKKNICLKFTMRTIGPDDDMSDRIRFINTLVKHEKVREGLGFLFYCVKNVYSAVVETSVINKNPLINTKIALDEQNHLLYMRFQHELMQKKEFFELALGNIMEMRSRRDEFPKNILDDADKEFHNLVKMVAEVNAQITPEIAELEKEINKSYVNKPRIGIFVEELHRDELPSAKNMKPALPAISGPTYADPHK
jgi:hypothetical protein